MAEYVAKLTLEANGESITDFSAFTDMTRSHHVQVELMNKTGHAKITPRYQFSVDYVIPESTPEYDWAGLANATFTKEYENGNRQTYGGVYLLDEGDTSFDGTTAATKTLTCGAETFTED